GTVTALLPGCGRVGRMHESLPNSMQRACVPTPIDNHFIDARLCFSPTLILLLKEVPPKRRVHDRDRRTRLHAAGVRHSTPRLIPSTNPFYPYFTKGEK